MHGEVAVGRVAIVVVVVALWHVVVHGAARRLRRTRLLLTREKSTVHSTRTTLLDATRDGPPTPPPNPPSSRPSLCLWAKPRTTYHINNTWRVRKNLFPRFDIDSVSLLPVALTSTVSFLPRASSTATADSAPGIILSFITYHRYIYHRLRLAAIINHHQDAMGSFLSDQFQLESPSAGDRHRTWHGHGHPKSYENIVRDRSSRYPFF